MKLLKSSALYFTGSQAACTYVQFLAGAIHFAFNILNIGVPDSVRSSMRMAYVITEMSALTTNITFSHLYTS